MKVTIYELLGMVKDGKAPKKIKYNDTEYYLYDRKSYLKTDNSRFFDSIYFKELNDEVEIIEEEKKIPMKIYWKVDDDTYTTTIGHKDYKGNKNNFEELSDMYRQKINEIIDCLDYLISKGE